MAIHNYEDGFDWWRDQIEGFDAYDRQQISDAIRTDKLKIVLFEYLTGETQSYLKEKYGDNVGQKTWTCIGSRYCFQVDLSNKSCGCEATVEQIPKGRTCPQYIRKDLRNFSGSFVWKESDPLFIYYEKGNIIHVEY